MRYERAACKTIASKHKAMSYGRMVTKEKELVLEVEKLLKEAEVLDEKDVRKYGKGKRGDELPHELQFKKTRLEKIRQAKRALEEETREEAARKRTGGNDGEPPENGACGGFETPDVKPKAKKQRNFTDPDSRIMLNGATKAFEQAYNGQAVIDRALRKLKTKVGQEIYSKRKESVEPVFGHIKENRGIRSFLLRGLAIVSDNVPTAVRSKGGVPALLLL